MRVGVWGLAAFAILLGAVCAGGSRSHRVSVWAGSPRGQGRVAGAYGRLPLAFEPNRGQSDRRVRFLAHAGDATLFVTEDEALLSLGRANGKPSLVRTKLVGASPTPVIVPEGKLPGRVNYLLGNDPSRWRVGIPSHARLVERSVYRGIDLAYYGQQGRLEYDFLLQPGADPNAIVLAFPGVRDLEIDGNGDLRLGASGGELREQRPVAYQVVDGRKYSVAARFRLAEGRVGFELGSYDHRRPLVIDPTLVYSTYLGGSGNDGGAAAGMSIAVDSASNAYVSGSTTSTDFPTVGPLQAAHAGGQADVFVSKLNPTGTTLVYSTYLGGSSDESTPGGELGGRGPGIAVDSLGSAYVTGRTTSNDFPTVNPLQASCTAPFGCDDAFVSKLSPTGDALIYSTFLGGSGGEFGSDVAVDSARNAYVTGGTSSLNDFPTANPMQPTGSGLDAFVSKLDASGTALVYSTYLGGPPVVLLKGATRAFGIAVDAAGAAYVTGSTAAQLFPTVNALQAQCALNSTGACGDAFVSKLSPSGTALVYSTYLGGTGSDVGNAIAVDPSESAYVTGETLGSTDFPTVNPVQSTCGSSGVYPFCLRDAFVTKLSPSGSALVYSTYLGGSEDDTGYGIAVGSGGSAYVTGTTFGTGLLRPADFPTANPLQGPGLAKDAFISVLEPSGNAFVYSTHLGGCLDDEGAGIAVDNAGNAYVVGDTRSLNFPTMSALQPAFAGGTSDAFVTKVGPTSAAPFAINCGGSQQQIVIRKQTNPPGSAQLFSFLIGDDVHPEGIAPPFLLKDGQSQGSSGLQPGTYFLRETPASGWDTGASCSDGSPVTRIDLSAGETVTCTFTNTQRGLATVVKTVSGAAPSGSQSFGFQLRQGASTSAAGTILESGSAAAANGGVVAFAVALVPASTYALCETVMPGWTTTLAPPLYAVFNPSGDNSVVCSNFTVLAGQTKTFAVDNRPPPGGLARTIGFWKNWASCSQSNGKQKPTLDQTLAKAQPTGVTIGTLTLHGSSASPSSAPDCLKAIRLLDKSTIESGKKMASDPAFNLAAQLLASKLNVVAGAGACAAASTAINNAQALLASVHFTGVKHDNLSASQASQANSLANTLDRYNNNLLC